MKRLKKKMEESLRTVRIVATGSSNTEKSLNIENANSWFDWLDLGFRWWFGRLHVSINTGISGQTSNQVLDRFEEDISLFKPFTVFITVGGNDSNPEKNISLDQFKDNLRQLIIKTRALENCEPILQTYYAIDNSNMIKEGKEKHVNNFYNYMNGIVEVAEEHQVTVFNHTPRWVNYRNYSEESYRELMFDNMHLNALGHQVWALDILRKFDVKPLEQMNDVFAEALKVQNKFDELEVN
ncbi:MAG: hypothetical protein COA79_13625 [Planctomycetota bacterium]|nr:MAG: hypothetical protein COA79_13625 [Planctomycetota bacterium]